MYAENLPGAPVLATMRALTRRILREPALHFVALGLGLFALHAAVAGPPEEPLAVAASRVEAAREGLRARLGREPGTDELAAALREALDEDRLYHEALRLGLDRDDPIVRRRLVQKLRLIYEAGADEAEADDAALIGLRDADPGRYATPARVALTQVPVARDRHADPVAAAREIVGRIEAGADPAGLGDPGPHARQLGLRPLVDYGRLFGAEFVAGLQDMPEGTWSVVPSPFGAHAVRIEARVAAGEASLAALRGRLRSDLAEQRRAEALEAALESLRRREPAVFDGVTPTLRAAIERGP